MAGKMQIKAKYRPLVTYLTGAVVTLLAAGAFNLIGARVAPLALASPAPVATWTATPSPVQVSDVVVGEPTPTPNSAHEAKLWRIIDDLEGRLLAAEQRNIVLEEENAADQAQAQDVVVPGSSIEQHVVVVDTVAPAPWAEEMVAACEDGGGCVVPANGPVARLCGVEGLGGYVVRWQGVHGDSYAGVVASPEYMRVFAAQLGGQPTVIWSRPHPRTGERVSIVYLPREMEIQLDVSGRPQWRLRADGKYTQF